MLANVQQARIKTIIKAAVAKDILVHTDEYGTYARLPSWTYRHKTACHGRGGPASDAGGEGFCDVHVKPAGGFRSLLRSWLNPHGGLSQDRLHLYLSFSSSSTMLGAVARGCLA